MRTVYKLDRKINLILAAQNYQPANPFLHLMSLMTFVVLISVAVFSCLVAQYN